ncbi:MAG: acyl-[acyl-carrier-protein] thioesterase [Lachnospiraceae bacterium]|nr:acyl-[acyl-carrier-protein] thioesterase [Lachnospiraceae bacterium]
MYYIDRTVTFSETGPDEMLKTTNLIDYYQDVCTMQSEELGVGMYDLRKMGYGWVVSSWQIVVNRYPKLEEKIRIGTAPYEFKGVMGMRNFKLETMDGEILSYANSIWSFVDTEKFNLARVPKEVIEAYDLGIKIDMDYAPRKIHIPEELAALSPIEVRYHNLDSNGHVNNAQYVSMAEDLIPEVRRSKQIRVEYRASAKAGNIIMPYINSNVAEGRHTVVLSDREMNPYVIVEFTL